MKKLITLAATGFLLTPAAPLQAALDLTKALEALDKITAVVNTLPALIKTIESAVNQIDKHIPDVENNIRATKVQVQNLEGATSPTEITNGTFSVVGQAPKFVTDINTITDPILQVLEQVGRDLISIFDADASQKIAKIVSDAKIIKAKIGGVNTVIDTQLIPNAQKLTVDTVRAVEDLTGNFKESIKGFQDSIAEIKQSLAAAPAA